MSEVKDYGEPWHTSSDGKAMWDRDGSVLVGRSHARIVACVNACAGLDNPEAALAAAREALADVAERTCWCDECQLDVMDRAKAALTLLAPQRKDTT